MPTPEKQANRDLLFYKICWLRSWKNSCLAELGLETSSLKRQPQVFTCTICLTVCAKSLTFIEKNPQRLLLLSNYCYSQIAAIINGCLVPFTSTLLFHFLPEELKMLCQGLESTDLEEQGSKNLMENICNRDKISIPFNIRSSEEDCLSQRSRAEGREEAGSYL